MADVAFWILWTVAVVGLTAVVLALLGQRKQIPANINHDELEEAERVVSSREDK